MAGSLSIECIRGVMERAAFWPRNFIETGTYQGETAVRVWESGLFDSVVTVEKSTWLAAGLMLPSGVRLVVGDSGLILGDLITGPSFIFLDAHWSGALGCAWGFPLLLECALIGKSGYRHLVVIDDLRLIGASSEPESEWGGVTVDKIIEAFNCPVSYWLGEDHINVYVPGLYHAGTRDVSIP